MPICSFGDAATKALWENGTSRAFPRNLHDVMLRKLTLVNAATDIRDLRIPPGNRLKKLDGRRSEVWSVRVNDQWRITLHWSNGQADAVMVEDYH